MGLFDQIQIQIVDVTTTLPHPLAVIMKFQTEYFTMTYKLKLNCIFLQNLHLQSNRQHVAMRLQLVLQNIINDDQFGYLKGCYIEQNIRILNVSFLLKKPNYL